MDFSNLPPRGGLWEVVVAFGFGSGMVGCHSTPGFLGRSWELEAWASFVPKEYWPVHRSVLHVFDSVTHFSTRLPMEILLRWKGTVGTPCTSLHPIRLKLQPFCINFREVYCWNIFLKIWPFISPPVRLLFLYFSPDIQRQESIQTK